MRWGAGLVALCVLSACGGAAAPPAEIASGAPSAVPTGTSAAAASATAPATASTAPAATTSSASTAPTAAATAVSITPAVPVITTAAPVASAAAPTIAAPAPTIAAAAPTAAPSVAATAVQNVPCGSKTTSTVTTASGPVPMGVSYVCYDVTGSTADAIRASINASPARPMAADGTRSDGYTRSNYRVSWNYASAGGSCRATSTTPTLSIDFTYPRWVPPAAPDAVLVAKWNAYVAALQTHENGHQQNGVNMTSDAVTRVRAVSVASCTDFNAAAQVALDLATAAGNAADIQYDTTTRHGATQGAVFP